MNKDTIITLAALGAVVIVGFVAFKALGRAPLPGDAPVRRGPDEPDTSTSWIRGAVSSLKSTFGSSSARGSDPSDYSAAALSGYTPPDSPSSGDPGLTLALGGIWG